MKPSDAPKRRWEERNRWFRYWRWAKRRVTDPRHRSFRKYVGILFRITPAEVKALWERDKAWKLKRPSLDRKDPDGHYEYGNCRFIELRKNCQLTRRRASPSFEQPA